VTTTMIRLYAVYGLSTNCLMYEWDVYACE
jgi:hypothetical protein